MSGARAPAASAAPTGRGVVAARGLSRRFGDVLALAPLDVTIGPGGITGLLGPNGAGKSTFLRALLGLVPRSAGSASVDGVALAGDGVGIRQRVAYAPGEIALYGELTARQHVEWLLRGRGRETIERGVALARELGLPIERKVRGFSHGMKRLVLLSAALAPDVRVRILDEPTEGLDPTKRAQLLDHFERDAARGTTILLSSHHLGEVDRVCDRLLFLGAGRLLDERAASAAHARLKRSLRIEFGEPLGATGEDVLRTTFARFGEVHVDETRALVLLTDDDARPALAALVSAGELAAPTSVTFGELTLHELYRELYGKEGV